MVKKKDHTTPNGRVATMAIYRAILPWFNDEAKKAFQTNGGLDAVLSRAGDEWKKLFGLPILGDDADAWQAAALAAGFSQSDYAKLSFREVADGVLAWAVAKCSVLAVGRLAGNFVEEAKSETVLSPPIITPSQAVSGPRKATVEAKMFDLINKKPESHAWSVQKFADELACSKGAVGKTKVWRELSTAREMARQGRSKRAYHKNRDRSQ